MSQASISQHNRVLSIWPTGNARSVTKRVREQAEARAKVGRREGLLESGYYQVEVSEDGFTLDREDLIA